MRSASPTRSRWGGRARVAPRASMARSLRTTPRSRRCTRAPIGARPLSRPGTPSRANGAARGSRVCTGRRARGRMARQRTARWTRSASSQTTTRHRPSRARNRSPTRHARSRRRWMCRAWPASTCSPCCTPPRRPTAPSRARRWTPAPSRRTTPSTRHASCTASATARRARNAERATKSRPAAGTACGSGMLASRLSSRA
mmetsp:Transcript_4887/g.15156  ORF Transcript_4887/g.15156 Transcript_4887/m.15156 type:complete len:200 (+) Transcript_4887:124-723(+)